MDPIDMHFWKVQQRAQARIQSEEWARAQSRMTSRSENAATWAILFGLVGLLVRSVVHGLRAITRSSWSALIVLAFTILAVLACCGGLPH